MAARRTVTAQQQAKVVAKKRRQEAAERSAERAAEDADAFAEQAAATNERRRQKRVTNKLVVAVSRVRRSLASEAAAKARQTSPTEPPTLAELVMAEQDPDVALRMFYHNSHLLHYTTTDPAEEAALASGEQFTADTVPEELKMTWDKVKDTIVTQVRCLHHRAH